MTSAPRHERLEYRRFNAFHRWMHFLALSSFTVLVFTGMPLRYKDAAWAHWVMTAMGGVIMAGVWHRLAALVTIVYFVLELGYIAFYVVSRRGPLFGPDSIVPSMKDLRDIVAMFKWFFGKGPFPQFNRFTYWEKFDFWSLMAGTVIIGTTGLMMWFPLFTTRYLPGVVLNVALVIHSNEALLAMGVIFIFVHLFSAHGRPGSFPIDKVIFTGSIPVDHYRLERPLEYANRIRAGTLDAALVPAPAGPRAAFGNVLWWLITFLAVLSALGLFAFIVWSILVSL
jgi:cytochrome b subunit of formate dehydrogenase